jgi:hypothetical protein
MDYDGKRDRWSGYDPSEHKAIIEEYQKIEEAKRHLRAEKLNSTVDGNVEVLKTFLGLEHLNFSTEHSYRLVKEHILLIQIILLYSQHTILEDTVKRNVDLIL